MARKRWRMERFMVVPAQWQGSVEHFYHFFLGYFMPVVLWQEKTGEMAFTVRDCGPMNPWFGLLRPGTDLQFIPPGVMLQRVLTHLQERQIVRGWDDPTRFHRASLSKFSAVIRERVAAPHAAAPGRPRITVLDRRSTPAFYEQAGSEVFSSGAQWRSIPNSALIAEALMPLGDVEFVDAAELSPDDQVRRLAATDLLVAQHGAGLANMVWMRPQAAVLEIAPPLPPTIDVIFRNLAAACGLGYVTVEQSHEHALVEPGRIADAADALLAAPTRYVPTLPGRFPLRQLRQLPRRL